MQPPLAHTGGGFLLPRYKSSHPDQQCPLFPFRPGQGEPFRAEKITKSARQKKACYHR
jgi:hypothetical protein